MKWTRLTVPLAAVALAWAAGPARAQDAKSLLAELNRLANRAAALAAEQAELASKKVALDKEDRQLKAAEASARAGADKVKEELEAADCNDRQVKGEIAKLGDQLRAIHEEQGARDDRLKLLSKQKLALDEEEALKAQAPTKDEARKDPKRASVCPACERSSRVAEAGSGPVGKRILPVGRSVCTDHSGHHLRSFPHRISTPLPRPFINRSQRAAALLCARAQASLGAFLSRVG
jgi:hypothetical protein